MLGSLHAVRLHDAGHDVSLLARGARLAAPAPRRRTAGGGGQRDRAAGAGAGGRPARRRV
ncbi:hypothetical protein [Dactylosporangium matsuzakiense]|uniref:hypothetical protein n=1 Tax=Dactylosporangium matsuzakiense TaxID=53360 RepID=UPI0036F1E4C1